MKLIPRGTSPGRKDSVWCRCPKPELSRWYVKTMDAEGCGICGKLVSGMRVINEELEAPPDPVDSRAERLTTVAS